MDPLGDGLVMHLGDDSTQPIEGVGIIDLVFTFGKVITLVDVLYVPTLCSNLVSTGSLNCFGYKKTFESNKYILSRSGMFVGFGYYKPKMFKLNLLDNTNNMCLMSRFGMFVGWVMFILEECMKCLRMDWSLNLNIYQTSAKLVC